MDLRRAHLVGKLVDIVTETKWLLAFVLPNFSLWRVEARGTPAAGLGLETTDVAFVEAGDPRLLRIRAESTGADKLLGGFIDEHGEQHRPAALILRATASIRRWRGEHALLGYRNGVAIAVLLRTAADRIARRTGLGPLYADTFFIHPTMVMSNGVGLVTQAPGFVSTDPRPGVVRAMASPHISRRVRPLRADSYLLRAFTKEWESRFVGRRAVDTAFARSLFRSLDVAFQAAAAPTRNGGSMHDYGVVIALWISAIEILVWPSKRRADQRATLAFLATYDGWTSSRLRRRSNVAVFGGNKGKTRVRWIEWACNRLYDARNSFLHGDPVSRQLFSPVRSNRRTSLMEVAPLIYRTALCVYLAQRYPTARSRLTAGQPDDLGMAEEMFDSAAYEAALLELISRESD